MQAKLLRVLENGEYQRVGETQRRVARARVVAATNRDLRQEVRQGRFRADLYHRLSVLTLAVPALRDMGRDRLVLLEHFRALYAAQAHVAPFTLDAGAERAWLAYPFPGNVRELRNIVIRLTTKFAGKPLSAAELEPEFDLETQVEAAPAGRDLAAEAQRDLERGGFSLDQTLKAWERAYVEAALRMTRGNMSQAAKLLGVNRTTLYSRLSAENGEAPDHGLSDDAFSGPQGAAPAAPKRR
jgi:two-component system nitrogen regulation response regulator GlnG